MVRVFLWSVLACASANLEDEASSLLSLRSQTHKAEKLANKQPGGYGPVDFIPTPPTGFGPGEEDKAPCDEDETPPEGPPEEMPPPMPLPETNCPQPANSKVCHFWGDPHFTHLFTTTEVQHSLTNGMKIGLKGGHGGKYCADDGDLGVRCNRDALLGWEQFTVELVGPDAVALRGGQKGKYCADEGHRLICNRDHLLGWETFKIVELGGEHQGKLALKGGHHNGQFTCADELERVICDRPHILSWERFTLEVVSAGTASAAVNKGLIGNQHTTIVDYHGQGVFNVASSDDGDVQVQEFFCRAYGTTTTGVATAIKFGDDIVQVVRGAATAPTSDDPKANQYYMDFPTTGKDEHDYTEFYVNGERVNWEDFAEPETKNKIRARQIDGVGGGMHVGAKAFIQQMRPANLAHNPIMPVCAGDGKSLVEISVPRGNTDKAKHVYHQGMTVRMENPSGDGLCTENVEGFNGDKHRTEKSKILFTSRQMQSLCDMCRLKDDHGACGAPDLGPVSPQIICKAAGQDYNAVKDECSADMDDPKWLEACIIETCAQGPGEHGVVALEKQIAEEGTFKE